MISIHIIFRREKDPRLRKLDKPYIRTSAKVTVKHLKKYIQKKLTLDDTKDVWKPLLMHY